MNGRRRLAWLPPDAPAPPPSIGARHDPCQHPGRSCGQGHKERGADVPRSSKPGNAILAPGSRRGTVPVEPRYRQRCFSWAARPATFGRHPYSGPWGGPGAPLSFRFYTRGRIFPRGNISGRAPVLSAGALGRRSRPVRGAPSNRNAPTHAYAHAQHTRA